MRLVWLAIGWCFLGMAVLGTVLPVMPTVPFLLVAAWAFSRSSPELRERVRQDPRYGEVIRNWQDRGMVPRRAKIWAVLAMTAGVVFSAWLGLNPWLLAAQAAICLAVAAYLVTRPEP